MNYIIRVRGHLAPSWSERFYGLTIRNIQGGICELSGEIADQAALYGLLAQVRDLGLELLAVNRAGAQADERLEPCGRNSEV